MKYIKIFEQFLNEQKRTGGSGKIHYPNNDDKLSQNFKKDYLKGKLKDIYIDYQGYPLFLKLNKMKVPFPQGKQFKVQKPLWYFGVIQDKSFFNGPNKTNNVFMISHLISNNIMKVSQVGRYHKEFLFIRDIGLFQIGTRDISNVPEEYKSYL